MCVDEVHDTVVVLLLLVSMGLPARHLLRRPPPDGGVVRVRREGGPVSDILVVRIPYLDKNNH